MSNCSISSFSIATFNLFNYLAPPNAYYQFDNIYTAEEWRGKQRWLEEYLLELSADMIAFQEVFSPEDLNQQCVRLGYTYFACRGAPKVESDYVYSQPPVALASRFPIISSTAIESRNIRNVSSKHAFSRAPLHCVIEVPRLGLIDVIVVHLKSQRSLLEVDDQMSEDQRHQASVHGGWLSTEQRGSEAEMLSHYIKQVHRQHRRPVVLLGDFNQDLSASEFHNLASVAHTHALHDSFALQKQRPTQRPATHYFGDKGNVLDYLLLSNEFVSQHPKQALQVEQVSIYDRHLVTPSFETDRYASDHAAVKGLFSFFSVS
ncbi:endonuclease/exonuclease/phosphatase family protein [Vibrio astriarenae]